MAKLILKYEQKVLREIPLDKDVVTIGRLPGNDVIIDNLAVSAQHARICYDYDGERFAVEDLQSRNGTFLNKQRVLKSDLQYGDEVLLGKHTLVFESGGPPPARQEAGAGAPAVPKLEPTVMLDTRQRREFLQKATVVSEGASPAAVEKVPTLVVLSGKTDQAEYILTTKLAMIGKSPMAFVRLRRWFAPQVAGVLISKAEKRYQVAPSGEVKVKLNGQVIAGPRDLEEGDLIEVARVKLQFRYRE